MVRFAKVRPDNTIETLAANVDPNVQMKARWRWLPCPPVAQPSFDAATETITGPTYTVNANDVAEVWTKRALTAPEISARKDQQVDNLTNSPLLKVILNLHNRVRVLEAQPAHTMAQFKAALKALL